MGIQTALDALKHGGSGLPLRHRVLAIRVSPRAAPKPARNCAVFPCRGYHRDSRFTDLISKFLQILREGSVWYPFEFAAAAIGHSNAEIPDCRVFGREFRQFAHFLAAWSQTTI